MWANGDGLRLCVVELRKGAVLDGFVQTEAVEVLPLGEQRDPGAQEDGGELEDEVIHQALIQKRGQKGISADDPQVFFGGKGLYKIRHIPGYGGEAGRERGGLMGKDIVSGGGVDGGGIPLSLIHI